MSHTYRSYGHQLKYFFLLLFLEFLLVVFLLNLSFLIIMICYLIVLSYNLFYLNINRMEDYWARMYQEFQTSSKPT